MFAAGWLIAALPILLPFTGRAEFSHAVHLNKKIPCVTCHAGAPSSAKAGDNLLPRPELCLNCHSGERALKTAAAVKQPRKTTVTKFNHQLHLKLGNLAPVIRQAIEAKTYLSEPGDLAVQLAAVRNPCQTCHRGLEQSASTSMAGPAHFPRMADCLVCHNKIDPPFSCVKCHDEGQHLKPASHTNDWIDRHSSGKANLDKPSCAVCHGRRFTCLGCH